MSDCIIIADLVDLGMEPVPGVKLTVGVKYPTSLAGVIVSDAQETDLTDNAGRASITVPQGVTIEAWFPPIRRKLVFSTTGIPSINLADVMLSDAMPAPDPILTYPPSSHTHPEYENQTPPVASVNGKTGNVILNFIDVAADPAGEAAQTLSIHQGTFDHSDITHANRSALDAVSGTNTGDQDLSGYSEIGHTHTASEIVGIPDPIYYEPDSGKGYKIVVRWDIENNIPVIGLQEQAA